MRLKNLTILFLLILFSNSCTDRTDLFLNEIDPGSYDKTWWNRTPVRLIQTNLPEIEGSMDREKYLNSILEASANTLLFNTGGIVANYQTKLPFQWKNPYIGDQDLVADLIKMLHEKGIRYIARFDFSKLDSSIATLKPEWLYRDADGNPQIFNGLYSACINGDYYQKYSFEILKEAINNYDFDGIFFNMMGYTGPTYAGTFKGICQCENCRRRFMEFSGHRLPKDENDINIKEYRRFQKLTSEELYNKITAFIKQQNPDLVIYNYNSIGTSWIASESGSSMSSGPDDIYHATKNVKKVLGSFKDRTPVNLIMGFQAIGYRNIISSPNLLRNWWLENMLHGAPVSFVVVGTLVHYEDRAFFPVANELFAFHKKFGKLFTNIQAVNNIALIPGQSGEFDGMIKLLSEEHIMYDVIIPSQAGSSGTPRKLEDYEMLILADIREMTDSLVDQLDRYVEKGGKLLVSGSSSGVIINGNGHLRFKSLGVEPEYRLFNKEQATYLKVSDNERQKLGEDLFKDFSLVMMNSDFLKCVPKKDATGYLRLLTGNMYGPAEKTYYRESEITEFPGIIETEYGKGKTVFIPWQIGSEYNLKGNYAQRSVFLSSIRNLLNTGRLLETNASPMVEITHMRNLNGAFEWVGMINHSGFMGTSVREPVTIYNTQIRIKPLKPVKEIRLIRTGSSVKFSQSSGGFIQFNVKEVRDFEMALLLYKMK